MLESLAEVFPDATVYTLFSNPGHLSPGLRRMKITNSFLHFLPGIRRCYPWLLPLFPFAIRTLNVGRADLVISSSHCVAKAVRIPPGAKHICYCHTPMRYLWGFEEEYFGRFPRWLRMGIEPLLKTLKRWDVETGRNVDVFFCNSENVRKRIQSIYGREATVIHPPVNAGVFHLSGSPGKRKDYLVVSALTPYKRVDLVIDAFRNWNRTVLIAGDGPLRRSLEGRAQEDSNIRFLGKVTDERLRHLYAEAKAVLFPQEEDFGIVPLEAQACGTPVIAYARGGALESVKDGVFFQEQTPRALRDAVLQFESKSFDPRALHTQALQFDKAIFKHKIRQRIENAIR